MNDHVPVSPGQVLPTRKWRLMLYMSADAENLQKPLSAELEELSRPIREREINGQVQTDVYVVAQVETPGGTLKRYDLSDGHPRWVKSGDKDDLEDFLKFAAAYPADHSAFVFWGHSAGVAPWIQATHNPREMTRARNVLWDNYEFGLQSVVNTFNITVQIPQLEGLFRNIELLHPDRANGDQPPRAAHRIRRTDESGRVICPPVVDILAFDCCYAGSLEAAYDWRLFADYMLAPEASITFTGWQFDVMVEAILSNPETTPRALTKALVPRVGLTRMAPPTLSLYNLCAIEPVRDALEGLVLQLEQALSGKCPSNPPVPPGEARLWILDAFHSAASTRVRQYLDVIDLCRRLASQGPTPGIRVAARTLLGHLAGPEFLMDHLDTTGTGLGGVSIYCPWPRATEGETDAGARNVELEEARYNEFCLAHVTGWARLMKRRDLVLEAERRAIKRQMHEHLDGFQAGLASGYREPKQLGMEPKQLGMEPKQQRMEPKQQGMEPKQQGMSPFS